MSADEDDEALSWAGDRDATHVDSPLAPKPAKVPRQRRQTVGSDSTGSDVAAEVPGGEALPAGTSAALLVTMGILAGIYLLYTVGWVITVQHTRTTAAPPLEEAALIVKEYCAILVSPLWFAATLLLTRNHSSTRRLVWLVIGAIILVPWPFVFGISHVA